MEHQYEVTSNYGSGIFETESDALMALQMFAQYHSLEININNVKHKSEKEGYFECFPLAIVKAY